MKPLKRAFETYNTHISGDGADIMEGRDLRVTTSQIFLRDLWLRYLHAYEVS